MDKAGAYGARRPGLTTPSPSVGSHRHNSFSPPIVPQTQASNHRSGYKSSQPAAKQAHSVFSPPASPQSEASAQLSSAQVIIGEPRASTSVNDPIFIEHKTAFEISVAEIDRCFRPEEHSQVLNYEVYSQDVEASKRAGTEAKLAIRRGARCMNQLWGKADLLSDQRELLEQQILMGQRLREAIENAQIRDDQIWTDFANRQPKTWKGLDELLNSLDLPEPSEESVTEQIASCT